MVSAIVILLMVFIMVSALNQKITEKSETKNLAYLKSKAVFFADSLVKNSNEKEPEKGIALYDKEKKRVQENVIDLKLAEKLDEKKFPEKLKEIRIEFSNMKITAGRKEGACFEAKRFILNESNEKGVLYATACN